MSSCSSCGGAGNCSPRNRDRILLRGMLFHGYHGVFAEENKLGQKFLVDVDAWMDLRSAGESDDIEKSVSYAELYEQIKNVVEGPPLKLVETVANVIAQAIFFAHPSITDVRVKVCKPHVAVEGLEEGITLDMRKKAYRVVLNTKRAPWKHSNVHPELPNWLQLMTRSYFRSYVRYNPR